MINLDEKKSFKRRHDNSTEILPLSKSKLFDSDEDDCGYNWGFKKIAKKSTEEKKPQPKVIEEEKQQIHKKDVYKFDDPLKLKEEDRQIYLENLSKIYERNYVYIPSFCDVEDVFEHIDDSIDLSIKETLGSEVKRLNVVLKELWTPLYDSYVKTNRLSSSCVAYKLIVKGVDDYSKAAVVYENCLSDFAANAAKYIEVTKAWEKMDVDMLTKVFRESVGNVLLKHKDEPNLPLNVMSTETNQAVFTRLVGEDVSAVKKRVEKDKKNKNRKKDDVEEEELEGGNEIDTETGRPVTKEAMKNRGLVPYRNKANKNPRTRHRLKFKKAVVRNQNQVPRDRMDAGNYTGEKNGIRKDIVKARKIK